MISGSLLRLIAQTLSLLKQSWQHYRIWERKHLKAPERKAGPVFQLSLWRSGICISWYLSSTELSQQRLRLVTRDNFNWAISNFHSPLLRFQNIFRYFSGGNAIFQNFVLNHRITEHEKSLLDLEFSRKGQSHFWFMLLEQFFKLKSLCV